MAPTKPSWNCYDSFTAYSSSVTLFWFCCFVLFYTIFAIVNETNPCLCIGGCEGWWVADMGWGEGRGEDEHFQPTMISNVGTAM